MTGMALIRPIRAVAWELRTAWATGRRVSVTLDSCDHDRMEGHVSRVAATDAYVVISALHVPLDRVLAVHLPSRLGDSTIAADKPWFGRKRAPEQIDGQIGWEMA